METDAGDLFEGLWLFVKQWLLLTAAVVFGVGIVILCFCAGLLAERGHLSSTGPWKFDFHFLPAAAISVAILVLALTGARLLVYPETATLRSWGLLIGLEVGIGMLAIHEAFRDHPVAQAVAWMCCGVIGGIVGGVMWWFHSRRMIRWLAELREVQRENSLRRLEMQDPRWAHEVKRKGLPFGARSAKAVLLPMSEVIDVTPQPRGEKEKKEP